MALAPRLEDAIQRQVIDYIEAVCPRVLVWACPNGARRSASGKPLNAVSGLKRGAPDLVCALPGGKTLHIEVKTERGVVSDDQFAFHTKLDALGHNCIVVRSVDDVRRAFEVLGIETREARQ